MDIIYEKKGRIAYITINRPEAMNALGGTVPRDMREAFMDFRDNPDLRVAIITGAGDKAFCAGADIKGFNQQIDSGQAGGQPRASEEERIQADTIYKPFIAAINGFCLGGGLELAMTCDIRIAAEHAQFGLPEINIGLIPGGGGTQRLPRFVPRAMAAEILFTGNRMDAREAYRIGLVNRVVPLDQLMSKAEEMAEVICKRAPISVQSAKEAMLRGINLPLEDGLKVEREMIARVRATEDFQEGVKAFVEKRPAVFKAR
ncbi:MAG: enoyl-CoA hydratase/isomerase family protein [Proteobacteria bacterium]|nr:enoyl-CoA hydratase/isomerase family protein [Pseudomonadota bacterium]